MDFSNPAQAAGFFLFLIEIFVALILVQARSEKESPGRALSAANNWLGQSTVSGFLWWGLGLSSAILIIEVLLKNH